MESRRGVEPRSAGLRPAALPRELATREVAARAGIEPAGGSRDLAGLTGRCSAIERPCNELEPAPGVEPGPHAYRARALPESCAGAWKRERESNPIISWVRARCPAGWTIPPWRSKGHSASNRGLRSQGPASCRLDDAPASGAGEGTRTLVSSLEGSRPAAGRRPRGGATGGSRTRMSALGGRRLTARPRSREVVGAVGVEPTTFGLRIRCACPVAPRSLVRSLGVEPSRLGSRGRCSPLSHEREASLGEPRRARPARVRGRT